MGNNEQEFDLTDLTTNEGRLAFAKKHYAIGTECIPLCSDGTYFTESLTIQFEPRITNIYGDIKGCGNGLIYTKGKWAEIIKKESNTNTQKLSRQGLKKIHAVACDGWKKVLVEYGKRNPLEDYIELTQDEVDEMFKASNGEQKIIVSEYLKQGDGSVDVTKFEVDNKGIFDGTSYIIRDREQGKYRKKSFLLSESYNWQIKKDELGQLCLIPTKRK